jgi:acyl carrier protein
MLDSIDAKLSGCFATVFGSLKKEEILEASIFTIAGWDSLNHINLLTLIGEEFEIDIDYEEFSEAGSYSAIADRLRARLSNE